ncbi:MAG: hypothetical protein ACE15F_25075 [bacterium]
MKLTFLGGAKSVTGAQYLIEHDGHAVLVDCGMFQGSSAQERLNAESFGFDPGRDPADLDQLRALLAK